MKVETGSNKHWRPLADPYERLDLNIVQVEGPEDPRHCPVDQYNQQFQQAVAEMRVRWRRWRCTAATC